MKDSTLCGLSLGFMIFLFYAQFIYPTSVCGCLYDPDHSGTEFELLFAGTPDIYGNQILNVSLDQWTGSYWVDRGNITSDTYAVDSVITGLFNQSVRFTVWVRLNHSWADSPQEAIHYTDVLLGISGEVSETYMENTEVELVTINQGWVLEYRYLWDEAGKPEVSSYEITLRYINVGSNSHLLGNEQDLTETDGTFDRGVDGFLSYKGDNPLLYECGYWYTQIDDTGFIYETGFRPFHNADEFTIEIWFMVLQGSGSGSGLPSQDGNAFFLASQYASWNYNMHIWISSGSDDIQARIGNGVTGSSIDTVPSLELYNLYQVVLTWQSGYKPALYLNNSITYGDTNITGNINADRDLYLGKRDSGSSDYGNLAYFDVTIWDRYLTSTEIEQEYNAGPEVGFLFTNNLNNSWSFNEYSGGLYDQSESTVHDGLGSFGLREAWSFDFISQDLSGYLFPWPHLYFNIYVWLGGTVTMISAFPVFITLARYIYAEKKKGWYMTLFWSFGICLFAFFMGANIFMGLANW